MYILFTLFEKLELDKKQALLSQSLLNQPQAKIAKNPSKNVESSGGYFEDSLRKSSTIIKPQLPGTKERNE